MSERVPLARWRWYTLGFLLAASVWIALQRVFDLSTFHLAKELARSFLFSLLMLLLAYIQDRYGKSSRSAMLVVTLVTCALTVLLIVLVWRSGVHPR
jgi:hypothetical protein